jgi:hypothetical protein
MTSATPIASLRRFVKAREAAGAAEKCDLCSQQIGLAHRHLFDPDARRVVCACDACALLFPGSGETRYVLVPRRVERLDGLVLSDGQWDALGIPIGLAFFVRQSKTGGILAIYPSPAGSTESEMASGAWDELADGNPILATVEADVETLLVDRTRGRRNYYIAPVDRCYELVGIVRTHWRGLSGGSELWEAVDRFFGNLVAAGDA